MKTRFNLLINVVGAKGYRLARVSLDTKNITERDKELVLEHYFLKAVSEDLAEPDVPWEEGDFLSIDAKRYLPQEVIEEEIERQEDGISFEELKEKLQKKEEKKSFLASLKPSMREKAEKLLKTYSLTELKEVFKEIQASKQPS